MTRTLLATLLLMSSMSRAFADDTVPFCPDPLSPDCVVSNWGQIEPDTIDSARASVPHPSIAIKLMPVATSNAMAPKADAPVKALVSPTGLFVTETAALTSAIKKARFHPDGTIASGEPQIAAAAAAVAKKAGVKYALTLYIKVPQRIAPDKSDSLNKRVGAVNGVLSSPTNKSKS